MYVNAAQLADGSASLQELAELYTVDAALLAAVISSDSTAGWDSGQVEVATDAVASINRFAAQADAEVDARLVTAGYAPPLSPVQFPTLTVWARAIARYHLHRQRDRTSEETGRIERDYRESLRALDMVATGKLRLGAGDPLAVAPADPNDTSAGGAVRISSQPRRFDRKTLEGL